MVRDFQSGDRREARRQIWPRKDGSLTCSWPAWAAARTRMGLFYPFSGTGGEDGRGGGGGEGIAAGQHAARFRRLGRRAAGHKTYLLQDEHGQVQLDPQRFSRPGLRRRSGRNTPGSRPPAASEYTYDHRRPGAGSVPASWRAWKASSRRWRARMRWPGHPAGPQWACPDIIMVNLSGRGDKDVAQVAAKMGLDGPK